MAALNGLFAGGVAAAAITAAVASGSASSSASYESNLKEKNEEKNSDVTRVAVPVLEAARPRSPEPDPLMPSIQTPSQALWQTDLERLSPVSELAKDTLSTLKRFKTMMAAKAASVTETLKRRANDCDQDHACAVLMSHKAFREGVRVLGSELRTQAGAAPSPVADDLDRLSTFVERQWEYIYTKDREGNTDSTRCAVLKRGTEVVIGWCPSHSEGPYKAKNTSDYFNELNTRQSALIKDVLGSFYTNRSSSS